jgi:hypothetical protein
MHAVGGPRDWWKGLGGVLATYAVVQACSPTSRVPPGLKGATTVTPCGECIAPVSGWGPGERVKTQLAYDNDCLGQPPLDDVAPAVQITETGVERGRDAWRSTIRAITVTPGTSGCNVRTRAAWHRETQCVVASTDSLLGASDCRDMTQCVRDSLQSPSRDDQRVCADCPLYTLESSGDGVVAAGIWVGPEGCVGHWVDMIESPRSLTTTPTK